MSFSIQPNRAAQLRQAGLELRANCADTLTLIRQGVTRPVLTVWAVLLVLVVLAALPRQTEPTLVSSPLENEVSEQLGSN